MSASHAAADPREPEAYHDLAEDDVFGGDDELAEAELNCGQLPNGTCMLAGTEWCDWECPFSG